VRGAARRAVAAACAAAVVRAARSGGRRVAARAARRAVAQRRAGADGAGVRPRAAGTATRRSLDYDPRRRPGTRRAGPYFEPRAALRRRPGVRRRDRQRRPGDRAVSARRRAHPPGPRGPQPRRQRPPRRRAHRAGELRGGCPGLFASPGAHAERLGGGRTSSSAELIQAVAPRWAVVPVGYRNRFGHPSREVLERYRAAGAEILRTDLGGAVLVRLAATRIEVQTERRRRARYWLQ